MKNVLIKNGFDVSAVCVTGAQAIQAVERLEAGVVVCGIRFADMIYNELKDKVKSGITYDEFKTYLGNIEGVIVEKSSYSTKYTWASENGSYINGTFSNSSNKCTLLSGVVK